MKLESYSLEAAPPYAILSHTWGNGGENDEPEVLFEDWGPEKGPESGLQHKLRVLFKGETGLDELDAKEKGRKLLGFCLKARKFGLRYGWIDTLCINKSVSLTVQQV